MMFDEVLRELNNKIHFITKIPYRGQTLNCNGVRVVIEYYPNTPFNGYCEACGIV